MIKIRNPFKKQKINGYETYSDDSSIKNLFKSLNPFFYSNIDNKKFFELIKAFLFAVLISSLIFVLILIPSINSTDFSTPLSTFDNLTISIDNKMNSQLTLPQNSSKPYLIVDTRTDNKTDNTLKQDIGNYSISLFETNKTQKKVEEVKQNIKNKVDGINSNIFIDNDKIQINTLFVKNEILFKDYKNILENQENYKKLFLILSIILIPSIILLFYIYLSIKFILLVLISTIISMVVCLILKYKIKFKTIIKIGLFASIPSMLFESFVIILFFNIWQIQYLVYLVFIVYLILGIIINGHKEKKGGVDIFN